MAGASKDEGSSTMEGKEADTASPAEKAQPSTPSTPQPTASETSETASKANATQAKPASKAAATKVTASTTPSTTTTSKPSTATDPKPSYSNADAREEILRLVKAGKIREEDVRACRAVLKDHAALKDKIDKLKSLLGRSAKAQRESKVDLEATQKRLHQALREIEKLNQRLEKIQNRPTHMDLLMDFETNFDKALLSVGQAGGQDTAPNDESSKTPLGQQHQHHQQTLQHETSALDDMLMQELGEARERTDKLEALNSSLTTRCLQLESNIKSSHRERDEVRKDISRLQMEAKIARMEADQATRALHDKTASLEEMQMEIDLVTKANAKANARAVKGDLAANSVKTDREKVIQLEAQVQALREWALASAESKRLMQERVTMMENKLRKKGHNKSADGPQENVLLQHSGSLVVGAGDKGFKLIELGEHAQTVDVRFVIMRWKFDFSPSDSKIDFNILKGKCTTATEQKRADYLIKDRVIAGGAGGETEGAFNVDNCCTILWSNAKSWVRPRTVKYSVDVVALK